jgi:ABC-type transporter Mla subunit MlaD
MRAWVFHPSVNHMNKKVAFMALIIAAALQIACRGRAFRIGVLFPENPAVKEGCEVRYLGLKVGKVEAISLKQSTPEKKPEVLVTLAVENQSITIRREDTFRASTAGLLGEAYIDIQPGPSGAQPMPEGSIVRGDMQELQPKTLAGYLTVMELAAKLESLPEDKRRELLEEFRRLIQEASEHRLRNYGPATPSQPEK